MSMKHLFLSTALMVGALSTASPAVAGSDEYIGEIILVGYNFCPRLTVAAEGQLLPIAQNTALFSLYGTNYGGDGRTTFAMPDLRGRTVVGVGNGPGLSEKRVGQRGGTERNAGRSMTVSEGEDGEALRSIPGGENNMQPFVAMKYCVVTQGTFPSRS